MDPVWELIKNAQNGDSVATERLLTENQGLVWSIVRRYAGRGYDPEDLFQIGSIGLLKAIRRFDFTYDTRLSTYAVPMITGEIKRFLRDDGLVKVSRTIKGQAIRLHHAFEELSGSLGRDPTMTELSEATGLSMEETVMAVSSVMPVESLEQPISQADGQETMLKAQLADPAEDGDEKDRLLDRMLLGDLLEELSQEERELIRQRYVKEQTQTAIAKQMGLSQVQVCRMEKKILRKMRRMLEDTSP